MDEPELDADIDSVFEAGEAIDEAMIAAVRQSVARHKALNQSIVVFRDGKPLRLSAEEINLDDFAGPGSFTNGGS